MDVTYKRVTRVAVASAASLLLGTAAHGATVGAIWDPLFGGTSPVQNMYWSGQGNFHIDDDCLSSAPLTGAALVTNNSSCPMSFLGATVSLFNVQGDPSNRSDYVFVPADSNVVDMKLTRIGGNPAVVGIDTQLLSFGWEFPSLIVGSPDYSGALWLQWFNGVPDPVVGYIDNSAGCVNDGEPSCNPDQQNPSTPARLNIETCVTDVYCVKVSEAPEPGTMGLALGALGAGWFARRRKKTA